MFWSTPYKCEMQSISTNVMVASLVIYLCIDFILMKLVIAFCILRVMCDSKLKVLSKIPPRYLTLLLSSMRSGPALGGSCAALLSCCFDPNNMYSVLSEFSLSHILSIQPLILLNVSSSSCLVVVSCHLFSLNVFHREWASAKPLMLTKSGTTLLMKAQ